ncbi:MAG TPA: DUF6701 domain-containing protein [Noviherbaspirillum sp.]|nr:DUF6701 domain-containing protein [Noviherbaspirillum sp.]
MTANIVRSLNMLCMWGLYSLGLLLSVDAEAVTVSASPTSCSSVSGIGSVGWSRPDRATASDSKYATAMLDGSTTNYLKCTGYNFSIPDGATINGITVNVERSESASYYDIYDAAVRLVKGGTIGATDRSSNTAYTTSDVTEAHGGPTDLWGTTWSAADINDASFGAAFAATQPSYWWYSSSQTVYVDWIQITIDYSPPTLPFTCTRPSNIPSNVSVQCYCDTFGRTSLNPSTIFGADWVVSNSDGISNPYINQTTGLLRLTEKTNNNAKAATVPGIFPAAGNYISVEFLHYAYNGSGADGIALTLSDYVVPAVPGGYGGSLGYAQNTAASPSKPGFAGGWIGVALDEFGNYQNPTEGRVLGPGFLADSVGVRGPGSGTSGYRWLGGTAANQTIDVSGSTPGPGYMYQVIVDARDSAKGTINVSVNRDTTTKNGAKYDSLFGPFNAYTEADYAVKQGWISKILPDYWKVSFTGSTGASNNIHEIGALRVCAQSIYPPSGGVASGFSAIDEAYPQAPGSNTPAYQNFQNGHIYMKLAGTPFQLWIAALNDLGIETGYGATGTKYVQLNLVDNSDNGCGAIGSRTCGATSCAGKTAVASQILSFTSTDKGAKLASSFTLDQAYQNLVAVMKECTGSSCSSFTTTAPACSVDSFSVRPTGVTSMTSPNATNNNTTGLPVFKAGGDNFTLTAAISHATSKPSGYTGVLKVNNAAVQPYAPATVAGSVSGEFGAANSATSTATGASFTYSEVGAFTLPGFDPATDSTSSRGVLDGIECKGRDAALCDTLRLSTWTSIDSLSTVGDCIADSYSNTKNNGKYGCNFGLTNTTLAFGRFTPHHFDVSNVTIATRNGAGCAPPSTFTYMGEPFRIGFTLTALNAGETVTKNYTGSLAKLSTTDWLQYGTDDSIGLWMIATGNPVAPGTCSAIFSKTTPSYSTTFSCTGVTNPASVSRGAGPRVAVRGTPAAPNWVNGVSTFAADVTLEQADRPDGPYTNLNIGIAPQDTDKVVLSSFDMDADNNGSNERRSLGATEVRYGRMRVDNAYGSELLPLPVNVAATFWDGRYFVTNTQDNCTSTTGFSLGSWTGGLVANSVNMTNNGALLNGVRTLTLSRPAPAPTSQGSVLLNSNLPYLSGRGRETFGIYKSKFIYLREMY